MLQEEAQRAAPEKEKILEFLRKSGGDWMEGVENAVVTEVFINIPILEHLQNGITLENACLRIIKME